MFFNIIPRITHLPEDMKLIYIYRYISMIITSLFYVFANHSSSLKLKILMIVCLSASSIIFNYLYTIKEQIGNILLLFIIIEVIANTLILIPTGGINSPYIWYSLNSILVTVYFYSIYTSFLILLIYQVLSFFLSQAIFHNRDSSFFMVLTHNSNLMLSFILIIVTVQLLINQAKRISIKSKDLSNLNKQLITLNDNLEDSMEQIMNLYQAVNTFTTLNNKDKLIDILINYTKEITRSPLIMLYGVSDTNELVVNTSKTITEKEEVAITESVKNKLDEIKNTDLPTIITILTTRYMVIPVNSSSRFYGILGIELNYSETDVLYKQTIDQMRFLASLSSITLERFDLDTLRQELLVNEEQNRIANELHDSVSQRLFALSCGLFRIIRKTENNVSKEVTSELIDMKDSLNTTIQELRETIYGMSWNKQGISVFKKNIKKYINDISKLYRINISFNMSGNEEFINSIVKKTLYRIICEGVGNSARHGKSNIINVNLNIDRNSVKLSIKDDGIGFDISDKARSGIGIKNICNLVYALNGSLDLQTQTDGGTQILVSLPNSNFDKEKGKVV